MLTITATVTRIEPDYVYLSQIKDHGRSLSEIGTHRMFAGKWSKRIKSEGSVIAFNAAIEHRTISGFDGEERYQANRLSIRKPSMAQVIRSG